MNPFVDPRVRMRNALHALVRAEPEQWHEPSLLVFRNRLLDDTGSDARPLADLLIEAIHRGWRERLPREPMEPARWDALAAPFVMQWSAERFIQPDMAQWAAESWGFALGVIAPEQLRIVPPAPPRPAPRTATAPTPAPPTLSGRAGARSPVPPRSGMLPPSAAGRAAVRPASRSRYVPSTYAGAPQPNPKLVWGLAGAAVFMYLVFIARMAWTVNVNKRAERAAAAAAAAATAAPGAAPVPARTGRRDGITDTGSAGAVRAAANPAGPDSIRVTRADSTVAMAAPAAPAPGMATVTSVVTPPANEPPSPASGRRAPGVPTITGSMLDAPVADRSRMLYVEPARRAAGNSQPVPTAAAPASLAWDEVVLDDGTVMRGRVEIVRAGTVIFRDMQSGLRHELRKESIDRIVTEFGSTVRFRAPGTAPGAKAAAESRAREESGVRAKGVAGLYTVRYAAAQATGSRECIDVWRRPPNAIDQATVRHLPGADTLNVAFDGGDNFPANVDPDGYFASTFRIVPDQARTSTALTTRLTGRFLADGTLSMQVHIVFFRRMREGRDITCSVNVTAQGRRGER